MMEKIKPALGDHKYEMGNTMNRTTHLIREMFTYPTCDSEQDSINEKTMNEETTTYWNSDKQLTSMSWEESA